MPLAEPIEGDVVLSFPLTSEKLENVYIDARLYEYDPFLADAPATFWITSNLKESILVLLQAHW